jgi:hypothetical protein
MAGEHRMSAAATEEVLTRDSDRRDGLFFVAKCTLFTRGRIDVL